MQSWVGKKIIFKSWNWSLNFQLHHLQFVSHVFSFYCIWKRWMVSFRGIYWRLITYFILLRMFRFFLFFFLVFFWVLLLAEVFTWVWGYLKKAVEFSLSHLLKISLKENLICFKILGIWSNILYLFVIYFFANPFLLNTRKTWGIHRAWKSCFLLPTYKPAT